MLAQDIAVLHKERSLQVGTVEEIQNHPGDVYVTRLVGIRW
jgi:ABC-type proline/glycine betaine transport system ATPase subunit